MKAIKSAALNEMVGAAIRLDKPMVMAVSADDQYKCLSNIVFLPIGTPDSILDEIRKIVGEIMVATVRKQDFE